MTAAVSVGRRRVAASCGLAAAAGMVAITLIAGAFTPDYSHAGQYISELGARGAPLSNLVSLGGFMPVGVLLIGFVVAAQPAFGRDPRSLLGCLLLLLPGVSWLTAGVLPCDAGCPTESATVRQMLHNLAGLFGYLGAAAGIGVIGTRRQGTAGSMERGDYAPVTAPVWLTHLAALAIVAGLTMMLVGPDGGALRGAWQRLADGALALWLVWVSVRLWRDTCP